MNEEWNEKLFNQDCPARCQSHDMASSQTLRRHFLSRATLYHSDCEWGDDDHLHKFHIYGKDFGISWEGVSCANY